MAHGLALAVMISCVGHISGGHFNPAVTTGFLVTGRMSAGEGAVYIASQLLGATLAALLLLFLVPGATEANLGGQALAEGIGFGAGIGIEIILTFLLVFTVFATAVDDRGAFKMIAGFGIGVPRVNVKKPPLVCNSLSGKGFILLSGDHEPSAHVGNSVPR